MPTKLDSLRYQMYVFRVKCQHYTCTLKGCSNYTDDLFSNILNSLEGIDLKFSVHKLESIFNTLSTSKNPDDQRLSKYFRITKVG